jgi:endonuclease-3
MAGTRSAPRDSRSRDAGTAGSPRSQDPHATAIVGRLLAAYPSPKVALEFSAPLDLLVATILSAQCTDARVNQVTRSLFPHYPRAQDYAEASPEALEAAIRPTGFYRQKARTLIACARVLSREFGGEVPRSLEDLTRLPGVGRKTANLVRGAAFGEPGIAVDTHVLRVSQRLGLSRAGTADRVEQDLMARVPRELWTPFTLATILHGRAVCTARRPHCGSCPLAADCPWPGKPAASGEAATDEHG